MCLLHTENMFQLKQMRANLKEKLMAMVGKLGPEIFEDFDKKRIIKDEHRAPSRKNSDIANIMVDGKPISYYHEIELNNVFESLNISFQDISQYMEGLDKEYPF